MGVLASPGKLLGCPLEAIKIAHNAGEQTDAKCQQRVRERAGISQVEAGRIRRQAGQVSGQIHGLKMDGEEANLQQELRRRDEPVDLSRPEE